MEVRPFDPTLVSAWNTFIQSAKNSTFLFHRDYIGYHADRFEEKSLLLYQRDSLISVLPLSKHENILISYGGLTYGGVLLPKNCPLAKTLQIYHAYLEFLSKYFDCDTLIIREIPTFYHLNTACENAYLMHLLEAQCYRVDIGSVIDLRKPLHFQERKKRNIRKALEHQLYIQNNKHLEDFWYLVLTPNLKETYGILPVHSYKEIELLQNKFCSNIEFFGVFEAENIVAGTLLFVTQNVVHAQYISANARGKSIGALDFLFDYLIKKYKESHVYFSLGISTEKDGYYLNKGLHEWKEGFGSLSWNHNFYKIDLKKYENLHGYM